MCAKGIKLLAVFLVLMLGLSACGTSGQGEEGGKTEGGEAVAYTTRNQLETEFVAEQASSSAVKFEGTMVRVSGLADKDMEETINKKIEDFYHSYAGGELPPYRGVKAKVTEDMSLENESVNMYVSANFNNILSLGLSRNLTYESGPYEYETVSVSQTETLNLDLNTGETFSLEAVFAEGSDYKQKVDQCVAEWISENSAEEESAYNFDMSSPLRLAAPFKGISAGQKFLVGSNYIGLIFDYETPEFSMGGLFDPGMINMDFTKDITVTSRFFDENENIYEAQAPWVRTLISVNVQDEVYAYVADGDVSIDISGRWYSAMPSNIKKMLKERCQIDNEQIVREMQPYLDEALKQFRDTEVNAVYQKSVWATCAGPFINVSESEYRTVSGERFGESGVLFLGEGGQNSETYDFDGNKVTMESLFKQDFDYEKAIKNAMIKGISNVLLESEQWTGVKAMPFGQGETKELDLKFIDEVYKGISGFTVQTDALFLNSDQNAEDIFLKVYGSSPFVYPNGNYYLYSWQSADYEDLGCENMTIFD